jgi:hypothetical protein
VLAPDQNIENNPMQSSRSPPPAWMPRAIPRKHFDTSGKSGALIHRRAICKTSMALLGDGLYGTIAGKKPFQQSKLHRLAKASRHSASAAMVSLARAACSRRSEPNAFREQPALAHFTLGEPSVPISKSEKRYDGTFTFVQGCRSIAKEDGPGL